MKDKLIEINDCIRECFPLIILISWLCIVCFTIKILIQISLR